VQSLVDEELQFLGRQHTAKEAIEAVNKAKKIFDSRVNIDLIYGTPRHSADPQIWEKVMKVC